MEIDWTEVVKSSLSIIAIIVSVVSATIAWRNTRKQIRVNKLEEIVSILYNFHRIYNRLYWLLVDLQTDLNPSNTSSLGYDWDVEMEIFFKNADKYMQKDSFNRLRILANSYLPNKTLKFKLMAIGELYSDLLLALETRSDYKIVQKYQGKIPKPRAISNYILLLERDIIKEMKLGFDGLTLKEYKNYKDKQFLVDIKLNQE